MPDTATLVPADVELLGMVRAARLEGLPDLTAITVEWTGRLCLQVNSTRPEDMDTWCGWWSRHGAVDWATSVRHVDGGSVHAHHAGRWRGHVVEIVHVDLTEVPA